MFLVIAYDIRDDRRRVKVAEELKNFGIRIQRSVFECHLEEEQVVDLRSRLSALINAGEDQVRYYRLCPKDRQRITVTGPVPVSKDWDYLVI